MNVNYYMEAKNTYKLNNYFNGHFYTNERIIEIEGEEVKGDISLKNFFNYYKNKLLSYEIKDLRDIFKESNFRISHLIMAKNRSLSISRDHIEFYDYNDSDNSYYDMNSKYEEALIDLNRYIDEYLKGNKKTKKISDTTFKVIDNDIIFHTIVDDVNKDEQGIYIIKNNIKTYIYDLRRNVCE